MFMLLPEQLAETPKELQRILQQYVSAQPIPPEYYLDDIAFATANLLFHNHKGKITIAHLRKGMTKYNIVLSDEVIFKLINMNLIAIDAQTQIISLPCLQPPKPKQEMKEAGAAANSSANESPVVTKEEALRVILNRNAQLKKLGSLLENPSAELLFSYTDSYPKDPHIRDLIATIKENSQTKGVEQKAQRTMLGNSYRARYKLGVHLHNLEISRLTSEIETIGENALGLAHPAPKRLRTVEVRDTRAAFSGVDPVPQTAARADAHPFSAAQVQRGTKRAHSDDEDPSHRGAASGASSSTRLIHDQMGAMPALPAAAAVAAAAATLVSELPGLASGFSGMEEAAGDDFEEEVAAASLSAGRRFS